MTLNDMHVPHQCSLLRTRDRFIKGGKYYVINQMDMYNQNHVKKMLLVYSPDPLPDKGWYSQVHKGSAGLPG
jgi:hypothetical protein